MKKGEIIKKAYYKAKANGFRMTRSQLYDIPDPAFDHKETVRPWRYFPFIPGFAKAFWGDESYRYGDGDYDVTELWKYHLQQMVLEEDPIKYLEQFL